MKSQPDIKKLADIEKRLNQLPRAPEGSSDFIKVAAEAVKLHTRRRWLLLKVDREMAHSIKPATKHLGTRDQLPGEFLEQLASFLLPKATYKKYVGQVIEDMRQEYVEAIADGRPAHARWLSFLAWFRVVPSWIYSLIWRMAAQYFRFR